MKTQTCTRCGKRKKLTRFYKKNGGRHGRHTTCKRCLKKYQRGRYQKDFIYRRRRVLDVQIYLVKYLLRHPCSRCGETDVLVLDFHHTGKKEFSIAKMALRGGPLRRIKKEVHRCIVLCSNCHRCLHANQLSPTRAKALAIVLKDQ